MSRSAAKLHGVELAGTAGRFESCCYHQQSISNGLCVQRRGGSLFSRQGLPHWIFHLDALGFIPLGLLDSSVVPVPGSTDLLTVVLAARERELWPYYALLATIGSAVGALVTYPLARKGGEEALAKRVKPKTMKKVQTLFERWGLGAIAFPAVLPFPVPMFRS